MKNLKKKDIIAIIFIICTLVFTFRYELIGMVSKLFYSNYSLAELTEEEKVADFEQFYSNMLESAPFLEEVDEVYGIDWVERKDYYLNEVKATENNIEFYGVMVAISQDLASFHTDVSFPLYSNLLGLNCYNSEELLHQFGMEAKINAWNDEIGSASIEYEDVDLFCVKYVSGKYILKEGWLSDGYKHMANYELLTIDGVSAQEYLVNHISIYGLEYDGLLDQIYRENYTFNNCIGDAVDVVWKDLDGNLVEQTLYIDKGVEVVASYGYLFSDRYDYYANDISSSFVTEKDDINQLEYIQINNFENTDGRELQKYLANTTYDTIVIDLRNNYGGQVSYAKDYVYPELYCDDARFTFDWKVPKTESNEKMTEMFSVNLRYFDKKDDDYYYYSDTLNFDGRADRDKTVYYLVGPGTGSAADQYIAMIKENGLGTTIGSNTGGEGRGASYICDSFEESSLVYIYYPSKPTNMNAKDTICGTSPDVYVNQTIEDYALYERMRIEGRDNLYESRLQYDTVLKWVIAQED